MSSSARNLFLSRRPSPLQRSIPTIASVSPRAPYRYAGQSRSIFTVNSRTKTLDFRRSITTATMSGSLSFNDAVVQAMRKLYPEELADKSWDNTGLLLDQAPAFPARGGESKPTVLLTNDLTKAVVDEALEKGANAIVCYHPVIFRPLKSVTTKDPMQAQLLRLIAAGITVYCPHTAVDAAVGGLNDWLCDILTDGDNEIKRTVAEPISRPLPESVQGQNVGYGRVFELGQAISLDTLLKRLSAGIGGQKYMMVACPPGLSYSTQRITKIAVCAGSGADVLKNTDAQVIVTGEMAHHYALRHTQLGQTVVTCFHSNSEREFLEQRLKPKLEAQLKEVGHGNALVLVSRADQDPFDIIDVRELV
ncbi:GTP cyclohydrolase 1 type 2/Nif3 [Xylaria sp. CBS 124048]|nr:GTP cyclohydrolase 1 type 2/Nif3 [Xylaria sp. CBS 124048]